MRVLLVDDEAIQRKALRLELGRLKLNRRITEFREASNGKECMDIAADFCPHLTFLDLRMPVMGGLEAARWLKENSSTRIVILTAHDDFKYAQEALKLGAVDYLLKPTNQEELVQVVSTVCAQLDTDEQSQNEKKYLAEQLSKVKPFIELEYVNEIVSGTALGLDIHQQKCELLGLNGQLQTVVLLEIDDYGTLTPGLAESERQALKQRIADILRQEIGQVTSIVARLGANRLIVLLGLAEDCFAASAFPRAWVIELCERVQCKVNVECGVKISIGVSRSCTSPTDLSKAFSEADLALSYKFLLGMNRIVHVDDVDVRGTQPRYCSALQEKELFESVRLGNVEKVTSIVSAVLAECFTQPTLNVDGLRLQGAELFLVAARACGEGGAPAEELAAYKQQRLCELLGSQSLSELRLILEDGIKGLANLLAGVRNVRNQRLVSRAIEYIKENYHSQITLDDLARQVYLSPFYFSHIFKEEVGTNFIDYLTGVRLDKAKLLLEQTMVAVHIIATQVGYNDVNYFSRVFKKVVGLTPTQYREKMFKMD